MQSHLFMLQYLFPTLQFYHVGTIWLNFYVSQQCFMLQYLFPTLQQSNISDLYRCNMWCYIVTFHRWATILPQNTASVCQNYQHSVNFEWNQTRSFPCEVNASDLLLDNMPLFIQQPLETLIQSRCQNRYGTNCQRLNQRGYSCKTKGYSYTQL